jgi:hypothetical protein
VVLGRELLPVSWDFAFVCDFVCARLRNVLCISLAERPGVRRCFALLIFFQQQKAKQKINRAKTEKLFSIALILV